VHLPRHTPVARLASLIEAEQTCCQFLTFTLRVERDSVSFDVTGVEGAEHIALVLGGVRTER
jgi:hypothetical protein